MARRLILSAIALLMPWPLAPAAAQPDQANALFAAKCGGCHGSGGWGTRTLERRVPAGQAELTRRKGLPAEYVLYVIRHGVGSMPPFTPTDLDDAQARRLSLYLAQSGGDDARK